MSDDLRNALKKLLSEPPNILNKEIWIWGAGDTAQLYQEGFLRLKNEGFYFEGYIDKNKSLIGEIIGDKKIYSPDILINKKNHFDDMKKYNREKSEMFSLKAILSKMKSIYGLE